MLAGILGSLLGFGSSVVPAIMDGFKSKQDQKFELAKMEKVAELRKAGYTHELDMYNEMGADTEHQRLIDHDIAISQHDGVIGALQRSVRPIITYAFFLLFTAIEISLLMEALDSGMTVSDSLNVLWDDDTKAIFASIVSFWFGSRAIDKNREREYKMKKSETI